ncbi:MAG: hypothetical protein WB689_19855, partial [Xanthobacteraceae bacterium]
WYTCVLARLEGFEHDDTQLPDCTGRQQVKFPEFYAEYFSTPKPPQRSPREHRSVTRAIQRCRRTSTLSKPLNMIAIANPTRLRQGQYSITLDRCRFLP